MSDARALSAELTEASGLPVLALSAAAEIGLEPVLDALSEHLGGRLDGEAEAEQPGEDEPAKSWSPL